MFGHAVRFSQDSFKFIEIVQMLQIAAGCFHWPRDFDAFKLLSISRIFVRNSRKYDSKLCSRFFGGMLQRRRLCNGFSNGGELNDCWVFMIFHHHFMANFPAFFYLPSSSSLEVMIMTTMVCFCGSIKAKYWLGETNETRW